jgi:transforming growth factor-beta-induced protein
MASQEGISQGQTVAPDVDEKLKTATIAETLARLDECSTLLKLVRDADLEYMLRRSGLHTLLAPSNEALSGLKLRHPDEVEAFLNHYLLPGGIESFDLRRVKSVKSLAGDTLQVRPENGSFRIGAALIVRSDIPCTNGVIHIVTTCS